MYVDSTLRSPQVDNYFISLSLICFFLLHDLASNMEQSFFEINSTHTNVFPDPHQTFTQTPGVRTDWPITGPPVGLSKHDMFTRARCMYPTHLTVSWQCMSPARRTWRRAYDSCHLCRVYRASTAESKPSPPETSHGHTVKQG